MKDKARRKDMKRRNLKKSRKGWRQNGMIRETEGGKQKDEDRSVGEGERIGEKKRIERRDEEENQRKDDRQEERRREKETIRRDREESGTMRIEVQEKERQGGKQNNEDPETGRKVERLGLQYRRRRQNWGEKWDRKKR